MNEIGKAIDKAMSEPYRLYNIGEDVNKHIIELLMKLHALRKLDKRIVLIVGDAFDVDAVKMCKDNGITYDIE